MDLKTMQEFLVLQRQAEAQGKPLSLILEEQIKAESERQSKEESEQLYVQIMPHNVVAGHGRSLQKVLMPRQKALDLAAEGCVRILLGKEDEIKSEDKLSIQEAIEEQLAVRRARDTQITKSGKARESRLSNISNLLRFEEMQERSKAREEKTGTEQASVDVTPQAEAQEQMGRRAARAS